MVKATGAIVGLLDRARSGSDPLEDRLMCPFAGRVSQGARDIVESQG